MIEFEDKYVFTFHYLKAGEKVDLNRILCLQAESKTLCSRNHKVISTGNTRMGG